MFTVLTWTWCVVPGSLSVHGLSGMFGDLTRVLSLHPGVIERSRSGGRVPLGRSSGLLPGLLILLRATDEHKYSEPGTWSPYHWGGCSRQTYTSPSLVLWPARGRRGCGRCIQPSLLQMSGQSGRLCQGVLAKAREMEEACSTALVKARLCSETRRRHDVTLTGPSPQPLMLTWKVTCLMYRYGVRQASHSHSSATIKLGTARFLTHAPLVDIFTLSTRLIMEFPQ